MSEAFYFPLKNAAATDQSDNLYKAYYISAADSATRVASVTQLAVGVLQNKALANEHLTIATGKTQMYAGGSVTAGDYLKLTTNGTFATANSGDRAHGQSFETVNSGNYMWGNFFSSPYTLTA